MKTPKLVFFVRSGERLPCPICYGELGCIGSRPRKCIDSEIVVRILMIRRLKCDECSKIHHELPDILVPYKRHTSECFEKVLGAVEPDEPSHVPVEDSTLNRWKGWFDGSVVHWVGALVAVNAEVNDTHEAALPAASMSPLQTIWQLVGRGRGWLARVVRIVVNSVKWLQTRSACLSAV